MNEKISSFLVNSVLTVLLIGILILPAASAGLLGVGKGEQVLSAQSAQEDPLVEQTPPAVNIKPSR
ncbi:MAG: hypothetical protein WC243_00685 [Patescibacteria group bacterium]|jgi:hypothetical protein